MWEIVDDGKSRSGRRFSDWFGRNLTRLSSEGGLAPFEGREDALRKMLRILSRTSKRHIAVIGKAGVGKTSLVEGLAAMLTQRKPVGRLSDCEVLELHGSDIASDCSSEAELTRRLSHLFRVLSRHKAAIFSLDELQGLFPGHLKSDAAHALLAVSYTHLKGTDVRRDVPAGSDIEVTINMDASRIIRAKAYIPVLDEEYEAVIDHNRVSPDAKRLKEEHRQELARCEALREKADEASEDSASELLDGLDDADAFTAIETLLDAAAGDPDAANNAEKRLLEVKVAPVSYTHLDVYKRQLPR